MHSLIHALTQSIQPLLARNHPTHAQKPHQRSRREWAKKSKKFRQSGNFDDRRARHDIISPSEEKEVFRKSLKRGPVPGAGGAAAAPTLDGGYKQAGDPADDELHVVTMEVGDSPDPISPLLPESPEPELPQHGGNRGGRGASAGSFKTEKTLQISFI